MSPSSRAAGGVGVIAFAVFSTIVGTAAGQRAANAPPLVPVRLDATGNFRIATPYAADPAFAEKPHVQKRRLPCER
jgi:hypothetical protein